MDHHRPTYHLTPPANWMNDPNGAIQWQGRYHLFYQHNPYAPVSKNKHWAHVVSDDLLHWEQMPIALTPQPDSYDKDGCFSGCMIIHNGIPTIIYTGVFPEVQCLATSSGDLSIWQKYPGNPVLVARPPDLQTLTFRDPFAWRGADGWWYLLLGSGIKDQGGACLLYRSSDLVQWEYCSVFFSAAADEFGKVWNCPVTFEIEGRQVLFVAGQPAWKPFFFTGTLDSNRFIAQTSGLVDAGGNLYATQVFFDHSGRPLFWGWIWEGRPDEEIQAAGWAGVMSLPRQMWLSPDGIVRFTPAAEVERLRGRSIHLENLTLVNDSVVLEDIQGAALELEVGFLPGSATASGIEILSAPDGSERTLIGYDAARGEVFIDRRQANLKPHMQFGWPNPPYHAAPLALAAGDAVELRIFIDHSVIEVFTSGGLCLSSRVYRLHESSVLVHFFARGGQAFLRNVTAWEMSL